MPSRSDASTDATGQSRILATLRATLSRLSALFVSAPADRSRRRWELPLVCALVIAGAVLRFSGLGFVGLHGDEETMAMPTMNIVAEGEPRFPSGMFYGRAIAQLYLMAASVEAFGASEWALRLPSAVCGVLLILLAWPLGRRFLEPAWNMAFVATVAFLPGLIEVSQTARMYIFLQAAIAGYAILVFRWERTDRLRDLVLAVLVLLVGLQFQTLAIFSALLLLFPGLAHGDLRKTLHGTAALAVAFVGFLAINAWANHFYPQSVGFNGGPGGLVATRGPFVQALTWGALPVAAVVAIGAGFAIFGARPIESVPSRRVCGALIFLGFVSAALLSWHAAVLMLVASAIVARRQTATVLPRLALIAACGLAIAVLQGLALHAAGIGSVRKVIGAMSGLPSIWTFLQLATYSPIAAITAALGCAVALWRMSAGKAISDAWLFFALGLWLPLLLLGFFDWFVAVRYTDFALLPLLICALVFLQTLLEGVQWRRLPSRVSVAPALVAGIAGVAMVNPLALAKSYNAGYADHPDHKGAAEFMRTLGLGPRDIVVAEDVLQQTYYLGRVDYWLLGKNVALQYCENKDGEPRDFYTGTRILGSGADLQALVARPDRGAIYIIGSGEEQKDGRRYARSFGIYETLESSEFKVVFEGRDGLTKIWRVDSTDELARHATRATGAAGVARR
jgi:dolichyl-phosphate-mannose-protein mannosyltransferase